MSALRIYGATETRSKSWRSKSWPSARKLAGAYQTTCWQRRGYAICENINGLYLGLALVSYRRVYLFYWFLVYPISLLYERQRAAMENENEDQLEI
jgi:hypothetical protein